MTAALSALRDLICDALDKAPEPLPRVPDLLEFVTSKEWCGQPVSRVQRAGLMAMMGRAVTTETTGLSVDDLRFHFGVDSLPDGPEPSLFLVHSGVRSGKSQLFGAFDAMHKALTVPLEHLGPGESVKVQIVSPLMKQSKKTLEHAMGIFTDAGPRLRGFLVSTAAESFRIRRGDGVLVTVELVAASPNGSNLRSTWLLGGVFDEAAFYRNDDSEAAVTLNQQLAAVAPRLKRPGRRTIVSSPTTDSGEFHDRFTRMFGHPTEREVAFHATSMQMNPTLDAEERAAAYRENAEEAAREWDAVPLSSGSEDFFPGVVIDACMGRSRTWDEGQTRIVESDPLPPPGVPHWAGVDMGYTRNSSALALARVEWRDGRPMVVVSHVEEHRPELDKMLKPTEVVRRFATVCRDHACSLMKGDRYSAPTTHETLAKLADDATVKGTRIVVAYQEWNAMPEEKEEVFTTMRRFMAEGRVILPDDPVLRRSMRGTKMKRLPGGRVTIRLPSDGWQHGDTLMATVLAVTQIRLDSFEPVVVKPVERPTQRWTAKRGY